MMMIKAYSQGTDTSLSERKKKKLQKRIERLLSNLRHERRNHKLHLELGDLYASLEDSESAEKYYMSAIELLRQGDVDEKSRKQVIMLYGKILNLEPHNYDAYTQLGQEYVAAGQKEKASRFLLSSGKKAFENGEYELALQCYEQVVDLGKSNPYIIERCTEIFLKLGRRHDAIENYVKIGDMYAREEKAVEALEYYKKASALDPESPDLILKVARMYYTLEWTENAAAEMVKIAEYHEQHQNFVEALKYFQHSLSLDRENDRALAGKLRISASQNIETPENAASDDHEESQEDILDELDLIEEALKSKDFSSEKEDTPGAEDDANIAPDENSSVVDEAVAAKAEDTESNVIDASAIFSNGAALENSQQKSDEAAENSDGQNVDPDDMDDFFEVDLRQPEPAETDTQTKEQKAQKEETAVWQDRLLDLNLEEDFVLMTGLDDQNGEEESSSEEEHETVNSEVEVVETPLAEAEAEEDTSDIPDAEFEMEGLEETEEIFEPAESTDVAATEANDESSFEEALFEALPEETQVVLPEAAQVVVSESEESSSGTQTTDAPQEAAPVSEDTNLDVEAEKLIEETVLMAKEHTPKASESIVQKPADEAHGIQRPENIQRTPFSGTRPELEKRLEDLEKQLENTEEEKYFLQEQFTAQISKLKSRETVIKKEYERTRKDKDDLRQRLNEVTSIYESSRQKGDDVDEARYEAIVEKIQRKKEALQDHVNKLLKQREQNGRFLAEELKSLGATKLRLRNNLEYIQQVKARVEEKIQTDLRLAHTEVDRLSSRAMKLEEELNSRQQSELHLHDQFDKLQKEKDMLQDQFTETISALTEENEKIGDQLKELSKEKLETEHLLKKKFKTLHLSYQRLKAEFKTSVHSKEMELNRTAQRLSQFADEYVRLETTLKEIRQERDKLEKMLVRETATRERLEENLTHIETQVDSLEVQGSELLEQLEEELDRQFTVKQNASHEFQGSLGELEQLLALQEKEIQSLEVL